MTILLIFAAWTFVLTTVAGLCAAARSGDLAPSPVDTELSIEDALWERAGRGEIHARAGVRGRVGGPSVTGAPLARRGGLAA